MTIKGYLNQTAHRSVVEMDSEHRQLLDFFNALRIGGGGKEVSAG